MPRLIRRPLLSAAALFLSLGLAGCETSDVMDSFAEKLHDFNPFGTAKKKLPGERHPVFPEGVPGVQQGIPPELMPGNTETTGSADPSVSQPEKVAEPTKPKTPLRRTVARTAPPKRAVRQSEPSPAAQAEPPSQQAEAPTARSAWDTAPAAPAAQPQGASIGPAGWAPPLTQPVPTIWPDPPQPATQ